MLEDLLLLLSLLRAAARDRWGAHRRESPASPSTRGPTCRRRCRNPADPHQCSHRLYSRL